MPPQILVTPFAFTLLPLALAVTKEPSAFLGRKSSSPSIEWRALAALIWTGEQPAHLQL
jgi:hypothetical protein